MNSLTRTIRNFVFTLVLTLKASLGVCFCWIINMITPKTYVPVGVYYSRGEGEDEKCGCECGGNECQC
jgi:hypothetical protein